VSAPGNAPLWSVLIASLAHREEKLMSLLGSVLPQAQASHAGIEVVVFQNNGSRPLGEYRTSLLRAARGAYLCFIDDDDQVPADYVAAIVEALEKDPDVVAFRQLCTNLPARFTDFSLRHQDGPWDEVLYGNPPQHTYLREFSHVQPVRSEIARRADFLGSPWDNTGEDMMYVRRVVPLLRERGSRELYLDEVLYHYAYSRHDSTQGNSPPTGYIARWAAHPHPRTAHPCLRWVP
jgi:glycosyltransferase involved in cell wall biosynthesis